MSLSVSLRGTTLSARTSIGALSTRRTSRPTRVGDRTVLGRHSAGAAVPRMIPSSPGPLAAAALTPRATRERHALRRAPRPGGPGRATSERRGAGGPRSPRCRAARCPCRTADRSPAPRTAVTSPTRAGAERRGVTSSMARSWRNWISDPACRNGKKHNGRAARDRRIADGPSYLICLGRSNECYLRNRKALDSRLIGGIHWAKRIIIKIKLIGKR